MAEEPPDRGHQDIRNKGIDDLSKRGADNDADRHIQHISPHREFLELFDHRGTPFFAQTCRIGRGLHSYAERPGLTGTWSPPESGAGSTWSPPELRLIH